MKKTNFITVLFLFSQLAFGRVNTQINNEVQEKELPPITGAIVFVDEQPSCLTFNENASADWKDTVQSESGLELCSQQKSSQELQNFVQNFKNDTIAEDSQYAFASHLGFGAAGCIIGAFYSLSVSALSLAFSTPQTYSSTIATLVFGVGAVATGAGATLTGFIAAKATGHIAVTYLGATACYGGISAMFLTHIF